MKKPFFIFCIFFTAVASIARYIAYNHYFDGAFFTDNNLFAWSSVILCLLSGLYPLCVLVKRKDLLTKFAGDVNLSTKILTPIIAVFVSFGTYMFYEEFINEGTINTTLLASVSLVKPFYILTIILCVYLIILSVIQMFSLMNIFSSLKFLELIPVIWAITTTVYLYIHYASSLRFTEDVVSVLASVSLMLGLLHRAKMLIGMDENYDSYKKMLVYSGVAFSMWMCQLITEMILVAINSEYVPFIPMEIVLVCASMSVLLLAFGLGNKSKSKIVKVQLKGGTRYKVG